MNSLPQYTYSPNLRSYVTFLQSDFPWLTVIPVANSAWLCILLVWNQVLGTSTHCADPTQGIVTCATAGRSYHFYASLVSKHAVTGIGIC